MQIYNQEFRERAVQILSEHGFSEPSSPEFLEVVSEERRIDEAHMRRLDAIVAEYGWPTRRLVGEEAADAALLLLQHAELEDQRRYFDRIQNAAQEGEADAAKVAMLEDSILQKEGKEQIYGSAVVSNSDGELVLYPIADRESVDERRLAVGLPPLEHYLTEMEQEIGRSITR